MRGEHAWYDLRGHQARGPTRAASTRDGGTDLALSPLAGRPAPRELLADPARARLAGVLVGLASPTGEPPPERSWVGAAPTHAALAREMGASRETVTRLLAGLEADGLIDRRGRRVAVPDLARLAAEAGL